MGKYVVDWDDGSSEHDDGKVFCNLSAAEEFFDSLDTPYKALYEEKVTKDKNSKIPFFIKMEEENTPENLDMAMGLYGKEYISIEENTIKVDIAAWEKKIWKRNGWM
jgi:hypothetical protein